MRTRRRDWGAFGFLLPATVIYLSVIVIPVFYSFYISLFDWNGISKMKWVGLGNYINLFTNDRIFLISIRNNLIWIFLTLIITM
jgi:ABC-type sugar transport system permease subunit